MADALASGASARKGVGVQVPPRARIKIPGENRGFSFCHMKVSPRFDPRATRAALTNVAGVVLS
jgi:hypothetical protein